MTKEQIDKMCDILLEAYEFIDFVTSNRDDIEEDIDEQELKQNIRYLKNACTELEAIL